MKTEVKKQIIELLESCNDSRKIDILYQIAAGLLATEPQEPKNKKRCTNKTT